MSPMPHPVSSSARRPAILIAGEIYALVDLAAGNPDHADVVAGSMAAGLTAILIAAIQGSARPEETAYADEPAKRSRSSASSDPSSK